MRSVLDHPWPRTVPEARAIQESLRDRVEDADRLGPVRRIAGADVSYDKKSPVLFAAVVVLDAETGQVLEKVGVRAEARFPYVPGLLSFREVPPLLEAFAKLSAPVDLVIADAHGRAHPRRFGLACHLGVALDVPAIGSAKSRLIGTFEEPGPARGDWSPLHDGDEVVGHVLRTRPGVAPIYASVGHRVSLETARETLLRLASRYRLPEPIRAAHEEVNRLRIAAKAT